MSWIDRQGHAIVGHDAVVERFRQMLEQGRLASTFLFVGPDGIGKRTFALRLAKSMLCSNVQESQLDPCGHCPDCSQVESDTHPDLRYVNKPADRAFIPVETFIGDREHRMRVGLCHFMSLTPAGGKRRIAIIDDADWLNQEGANSLLKTLEEPAPGSLIILLATSEQRQLPTIRSRSQTVRFRGLAPADLAACLMAQGVAQHQEEARQMSALGEGSLSRALLMAQGDIREFRAALWKELATEPLSRQRLTELINEYIETAGKETAEKRPKLREVLEAMIEFYRSVARVLCDAPLAMLPELESHVMDLCDRRPSSADLAAQLVDRCVESMRHVAANANLNILVDALVCDLAVAMR